ncbi:MAG: hypothetical protein ACE5G0_07945 [Rhodothermales bacterium]
MIALYDHIVAILIGGVIFLVLFNVQQRVQVSSVERSMMYMAKAGTLDLAGFLERDLMNAGFNTPPVETGILEHRTQAGGLTDTLMFWGVGASGARTRIAYGVSAVDSAYIDGEIVPLYELRRYERRGATFVRAGGSTPTLTRFKIDLLTSGNTPTDISTAKRIRVRLANTALPEFKSDTHLRGYRQLHWGVTLNPPGLQ